MVWVYGLDYWLGGHGACGWCGSSSSVCIPSLKFVGLAIRKIWRTMCVSIKPGDPDLWPFDLETGMRLAPKVGNLPSKFEHGWSFRFSNYSLCMRRTDKQTDGRTKATLIAPFPSAAGHNILSQLVILTASMSVITMISILSPAQSIHPCRRYQSQSRWQLHPYTIDKNYTPIHTVGSTSTIVQ